MENYREYMESCRLNGERMPYLYEEHKREQVLKQLKELLWEAQSEREINFEREEPLWQELLWILEEGEELEKGFYSCNTPDSELVVVASPALMALLMGEYDLSIELCKAGLCGDKNDIASELKQEGKISFLGGGSIRFCEACLLCFDMSVEQLDFFRRKKFFERVNFGHENNCRFLENYLFMDKKKEWGQLYRVLGSIKTRGVAYGNPGDLLMLILWYALCEQMDEDNSMFWTKLCELFKETEVFEVIPYMLHEYTRVYFGCLKEWVEQERLLRGMEEYFRHAETIDIRYIGNYISEILLDECICRKTFRKHGRDYFSVVKKIEGEVTGEWWKDMLKLLKTRDFPLIELAFKSGFLKEDCLDTYIQYFSTQKDYAGIIPYLIYKRWSGKESANGSI